MHSPNSDEQRELVPSCNLALTMVVSTGHSAGSHLALWLAARMRSAFFAQSSPLAGSQLLSENEERSNSTSLQPGLSVSQVLSISKWHGDCMWVMKPSLNSLMDLLPAYPNTLQLLHLPRCSLWEFHTCHFTTHAMTAYPFRSVKHMLRQPDRYTT